MSASFCSDSFLEHAFRRSACFSVAFVWFTCGAKSCSRGDLGGIENMMQKKMAGGLMSFSRVGGGVPIINLGLGLFWVMLPLGSGSWQGAGVVRLAAGHALRSRRGGGFYGMPN